jgi:hypothetical protein
MTDFAIPGSILRVGVTIALVLVIIFMVPFFVYGLTSSMTGLRTPEGVSPTRFLVGVLVSKAGTAVAFVLIFCLARDAISKQWLMYALHWWMMFVIDEIGQVIGPEYSWQEGIAGIISETLYFPLSAFVTHWILGK